MTPAKLYGCCSVLLLILLQLCSAARHEMFHVAHPLVTQLHSISNTAAHDAGQYKSNQPRQWVCSVHGASCDQAAQSCSSRGCSLEDVLPPHACIIYMSSDVARELLTSGIVFSTVEASSLSRPPSVAHPLLQLNAPSTTSALGDQNGELGLKMNVRCVPGAMSLVFGLFSERMRPACPLALHSATESQSPSFSVIVPSQCYHSFLHTAASIPAVVSVSHRETFKKRNRWAHALVQSHSQPAHPQQIDAVFWRANITGTGQIVAIGDTGVDTNLGFFYDEVSVPFCTSTPSTCNNLPPHRRFKAYIQLAGGDKKDDDGHGSHTTASIAGNAKCADPDAQADQQLYNGMAPDAKLVFSDISNDETLGGLPDDLASDYFPLPYSLGARVRSDSWGTSDSFYTESARDFDAFAFRNDDFLPLIAAGNDGDSGLFTVGAPATAKNCIAVGATGNAAASYLYLSDHDLGMRVDAPSSPSCAYSPPQPLVAVHPAGFGPKILDGAFQGVQLVGSSPVDACSPLVGSGYTGKIVLIVRGICTFVEKVRAASVAGAAGVIVYNNVGGILRMGGVGSDITIPSMSIIQEMGNLLSCLMSVSSSVKLTLPLPIDASGDVGPEYVAAFSSLGPTMDGRLKPDLMAPGEFVFSARANPLLGSTPAGYCAPLSATYPSIKAIMGTSMATPTLAGAAVLLRQWLVEGRYPDGVRKQVASSLTSPSGALIKALLLNSALPLKGSPVQRTPNVYEGYGAAVLADAVPIPSSSSFSLTRGRLWADDRISFLSSFSAYSVTFDIIDPSVPLVATLVWWDAPVSIVSPIILANDFDLTCFPPNGTNNQFSVYTGNGYTALGQDKTVHQVSDRFNSNERIFIQQPSLGTHVCVVTLERQLMSGSTFAIAITGGFRNIPISQMLQATPCTGNCVHGRCNSASRKLSPSACECNIGWTGIVCDIPVSKLSASSNISTSVTLAVETWQYFWFVVPPSASSFSVTFARSGSTGDPDFYVQQGVPPSVSSSVVHSTQCDSCSPVPLPPAVLHVDAASYKVPLPGLWFAGVFASCCNSSAATLSLRVTNAACLSKGSNYLLGCDGVCAEIGGNIIDYDTCGVCGGNGSSCVLPFVPTPSPPPILSPTPSPQPSQPESNRGSASSQDSQVLQGGSIGAITLAVIYYVCSACVSVFVFCRVRGSVRPVRLRIASFLWCFFGFTGAHRFYTKHTITGFIWLFTGGLCGVGWLVDLFLLRRMISRYNVHGSRLPKFFQGMRNRLRNRVGKNRYRKTINFTDDEISLDQSVDDEIALGDVESKAQPKIFDGTVEVGKDGLANDGERA